MENELEKRMKHDMETGRIRVYWGASRIIFGASYDKDHDIHRVAQPGCEPLPGKGSGNGKKERNLPLLLGLIMERAGSGNHITHL